MAQAPSSPAFRKLRGYAFDPSLSTQLETAVVNEVVFRVRWEKELGAGPVGEYLEVVDFDPASGCFYAPVELDHPAILAQDGVSPSEGNPQFHQQMVYAVAMTTIANFEHALGRKALWSPRKRPDDKKEEPLVAPAAGAGEAAEAAEAAAASEAPAGGSGARKAREPLYSYVPRLRIYPHALRQANAYYSPEKKALLFGYFPAAQDNRGVHYPGGLVFTCLSHDVVAHETTHALLDGMHRRFIEATHPDGLAFHEAFADIVALFQHFTFPEVLRHQIARTRGDLASQSLLGQLAQQVGQAVGNYGALRDAIGQDNPETGQWEPKEPNPEDYANVLEPHDRGAILVAAVFDAFISIYKSRVGDLFRIASGGTGVLEAGALHPDLVNRLATEAAKAAQHVLNMCIRALDYCPPVDITFGDYLRALVTADYEMVHDDDRGYRIAFIEAFRRRGIYPRDLRTLSEDTLRWNARFEEVECDLVPLCLILRRFVETLSYPAEDGGDGTAVDERQRIWDEMENYGGLVNLLINGSDFDRAAFGQLTGLCLSRKHVPLGLRTNKHGIPKLEVHSIRAARRVGPDGDLVNDVVVCITQRRKVLVNPDDPVPPGWYDDDERHDDDPEWFWFRGGCTLVLDLETHSLRYAVVKRIGSESRLRRQRLFKTGGELAGLRATYFGDPTRSAEPFAFLHASHEPEP
ncbi:MAG TPA: hypothetical protein VFJ16_03420 [Longimicrobium sp.]|nr:hypothetical protein [Longimicrobium sp.]